MQHKDIPQDTSALTNITKELCYAKNEQGTYQAYQSTGWNVKSTALDVAWNDIQDTINEAKILVAQGKRSPIYFYMHTHIMTISLLAKYVNMCQFRVWLHTYPFWFKRITTSTLERYIHVFGITQHEIHNIA